MRLGKISQDSENGIHPGMDSLEAKSVRDQNLLKQLLPLLSEVLQSPHPGTNCNLERKPYQNEWMAEKSIITMTNCKKRGPDLTIGPVETFVLEQMPHLLRWMAFLFDKWVYQGWRLDGQFLDTVPDEHIDVHALRADTRTTIPHTLRAIAEHPTICDVLTKYSSAGILIAQIFLVAVRSNDSDMLDHAHAAQMLISQKWEDRKAECAFFRYMECHSQYFAEGIVSLIKDYSQLTPVDHAQKLSHIVLHLFPCITGHSVLLDACLEQGGIIHALTSIFCGVVDWLQHCRKIENEAQEVSLSNVAVIPGALMSSFGRGGPALVAKALSHDLLGAILRLCKFLAAAEHIGDLIEARIQDVGKCISLVIEEIIPFVVYPSVMKKAACFISEFEPGAFPGLRTKIPRLQNALEQLACRIGDELDIVLFAKRHAVHQSLNNPRLYKFCDNTKVILIPAPSRQYSSNIGY